MAKKRKKIIKKVTENRKAKRIFWGILAFFALVCLGAALSDGLLRSSVGIDGFESAYSDVSSKTRKALRTELEDFVRLNTGSMSRKPLKFTVRDGQLFAIDEDEDGNKYSSFYIDSEELQISALVQMNWNAGFRNPDAGFIVKIDCATKNNIKFENSHCYSRSTGEPVRAVQTENLGLLKSYGVPDKAVEKMQDEMLFYLKKAYPEIATVLVDRNSIKEDEDMRANISLDNSKEFALIVENTGDCNIILSSGENVIWKSDAKSKITAYRHYRVLKKLLPTEVEMENGTRFALSYINKEQLAINSVKCAEGTKNSDIEQAARGWLEANNFDAETFEIKLKNSCDN